MPHRLQPNIGHWFKDIRYNTIFEVVASDDETEFVEIQYFDGEIEELDLDLWYELDLESIAEPEDWSGPYEIQKEDLASDDAMHPEDWTPLAMVDVEPEEEEEV